MLILLLFFINRYKDYTEKFEKLVKERVNGRKMPLPADGSSVTFELLCMIFDTFKGSEEITKKKSESKIQLSVDLKIKNSPYLLHVRKFQPNPLNGLRHSRVQNF